MTPSPLASVVEYRKQEAIRYSAPEKAFVYNVPGSRGVVAPCKVSSAKTREHSMMKPDRPPTVSVLSLVRDAASRLPGGVGTRSDVTTLLRDSGYVVEAPDENAYSSLVSGALDRLKSDLDPSVRYDGELKLWIYLHRQREESDFGSYQH
jgi:nuclear factor related to kappa-B-binding protein